MSKLYKQIKHRTRLESEDDLLFRMGYTKPDQQHRERLDQVLADPELGLGEPHYDLIHGSRGFLRALCHALHISYDDCQAFIAQRDADEKAEREAYRPWLFVEVEHEGQRLGSFFRAMAAGKRKLDLPRDTWRLTTDEQLKQARAHINEHMAQTAGSLPIWGKIMGYRFHRDANCVIYLTSSGDYRASTKTIASPLANGKDDY